MMKLRVIRGIVIVAGAVLLHGCAAPQPSQDLLAPTDAQMKIRTVQTRTFDVKDRSQLPNFPASQLLFSGAGRAAGT